MKGTLFHAGGLRNELFGARWLHRDPKNRAENIMITDLLRNDLGKICEIGSVKTKKLCEVAKYRTVFQMTSTVEGELRKADSKLGVPTLYEIFKALFPSGSVTGAPKLRSMQIIRELETQERRIYTGAIGFVSPNQGSQKGEIYFNVPIRTLLVEGNRAEMGIGGGITHYSTPEGEWEECQIKARFIRG